MASKSFTKIFFIVFFIASAFQLALMLPTHWVEQEAAQQAAVYARQFTPTQQEFKQQQFMENYLDSISDQTVFKIPYLSDYTYSELKDRQLKLGLDLRGGLQLGIRIDMSDFMLRLSDYSKDPLFIRALQATEAQLPLSPDDFVAVFFESYQQIEQAPVIFQKFAHHPALKSHLNAHSSIQQLVDLVQEEAEEMISETRFLIQQRVDAFGLTQSQVSLEESKNLILVEIPGVKNPETVKRQISSRVALEFWETYRATDAGISEALWKADQLLKAQQSADEQ